MLAFQSVFVKPIEYLVVGETTYFQIVVDESLMQGFQYWCKRDGIASFFENSLQSFYLFSLSLSM